MNKNARRALLDSQLPAVSPWKLGGLTLGELIRRVWHETEQDEILGRSAQLAYYFLLSLFPALIFLTAVVGLFPLQDALPELMAYLKTILPADALSLVQTYLEQVVQGSSGGLLSLGFIGALWASSSGVTAIIDSLNTVYGVKESRPLWKVRSLAILLTIGLAGFIILSISLVLYGEHIGSWIADVIGLGWLFELVWLVLQWPVAICLVLLALAATYYFCPDVKQDWQWVTPGSLLAVVLWLAVSLTFKLYVENFGGYNKVYGSIAGVIVLMLWFYFSGVTLLLGGELNAEIEKAAHARHADGDNWYHGVLSASAQHGQSV